MLVLQSNSLFLQASHTPKILLTLRAVTRGGWYELAVWRSKVSALPRNSQRPRIVRRGRGWVRIGRKLSWALELNWRDRR